MAVSTWCRSDVNFSFFLCLATCRTRSSACDTLSRSCVRRVWTCPCLVESHCPLVSFVFEIYWAFVTKSRMPAHGIIEPVDISGDGIFGLKARLEAGAPDQ